MKVKATTKIKAKLVKKAKPMTKVKATLATKVKPRKKVKAKMKVKDMIKAKGKTAMKLKTQETRHLTFLGMFLEGEIVNDSEQFSKKAGQNI